MKPSSAPRHFTEVCDLKRPELDAVLHRAKQIHELVLNGLRPAGGVLQNTVIASLSSKESLRTHGSIAQAAAFLGGQAIFLGQNALRDENGKQREPLSDMVRCLEEQGYPIIVARLHAHEQILEMVRAARRASIVNGLTNMHHPLQALADIEAFLLHRPDAKKPKVVFLGDGNNVATSLGQISAMLGWDYVYSGPEDRKIADSQWRTIEQLAYTHGGSAHYEVRPEAAVEGGDFIYADVFASMGQKAQMEALEQKLHPYKVTGALMGRANTNALFGHCLPAERGREVDADVIDGPQSIVFSIAGCRTDTTAALIELLIQKNRG